MNARDRRRGWLVALSTVVIAHSGVTLGQTPAQSRVPVNTGKPGTATQTPAAAPSAKPEGRMVRIPVKPTDAVALVNGEPITRQDLSEQTLVRKGEEVLEALISRKLIDQAIRANKMVITKEEIDAEIDHVASTVGHGVTREQWLRTLDKDRKISPAQYASDIIYPGLALKKLAKGRVQVSDQDMKDAFEAHFGEKLRCRIIMTMMEKDCIDIYNELQKNPGGFAHVAQHDRRSIDEATKVAGGMLAQPMTRHAYPRKVSDSAFEQLVDGDPKDNDPTHKPKDGSMTGPIQVAENTWVLIQRDGVIPATLHDPNDKAVREQLHAMIYEAKLKEAMSEVFQELIRNSAVENKLTGQVKLAREDERPESQMDEQVQLMSDPNGAIPVKPETTGAVARPKAANDAVNPSDRAFADGLKKTVGAPAGGNAPK